MHHSKPIYMTEFQPRAPTMLGTAWLIHNALTIEGVSAYIYWPLFWVAGASPVPPVTLADPATVSPSFKGYTINEAYYPLKHFARWVDAGWVRVEALSSDSGLAASAFIAPDESELTLVLVNTGDAAHDVEIEVPDFGAATWTAYRTSGAEERTTEVAFAAERMLSMPPAAIATVTLVR